MYMVRVYFVSEIQALATFSSNPFLVIFGSLDVDLMNLQGNADDCFMCVGLFLL